MRTLNKRLAAIEARRGSTLEWPRFEIILVSPGGATESKGTVRFGYGDPNDDGFGNPITKRKVPDEPPTPSDDPRRWSGEQGPVRRR